MDDTGVTAPGDRTGTDLEAAPSALSQVLPSVRLSRLAELTATQLAQSTDSGGPAGPQVLSEQALRDVLAAVDASTAASTKAAYRSDWARFTLWAVAGGYPPLPAPPLVVAHYVTQAATEMTGVGKWRYTPATLTRWVSSINQFHTAAGLPPPGRSEVVRRALSGVRRIRATPPVRRSPLLGLRPGTGYGSGAAPAGPGSPAQHSSWGDIRCAWVCRRVFRTGATHLPSCGIPCPVGGSMGHLAHT